jgi:hypothetical protein
MDGMTLLEEARAAGLTVRVDGARLVVRGPRAAEAMARRLLERKVEVLAALATPITAQPAGQPPCAQLVVDPADCQHVDVEEIPTFDGYFNRRCRHCGQWLRCRKAGALAENPGPGLPRRCSSCDPADANDTSPEPKPGTVQGRLPGL